MQRLLSIAVTLLACACSSMEVRTESVPDVNFDGLQTYAWLADEVRSTGDPRVNDALIHMHIVGAVEEELVARGFKLVQADAEPDLLVVYHAALDRAYSGTSMYESHGYEPGYSWDVPTTQINSYEQGSLVLDFLDKDTRKIVWRASAQARADIDASSDKRRHRIHKAIRLMLEDFPAGG